MLGRVMLTLSVLTAFGGVAASPVDAQSWLLGKRRGASEDQAKVKGKYLADGAIRADAYGGPFADSAVAHAVVTRLAEMSRDKGMPRFVIRKEKCWQNMTNYVPGTNYCWAEAVMLSEEQTPPATKANSPVVTVADILAPQQNR